MGYFFRSIVNRIQGRYHFKEEFLSLDGAFNLIRSNSEDTKVKVNYYHPAKKLLSEKTSPAKAAEWALKVFRTKELGGQYVEVTHQAYSGNNDEMHYVTLSHGGIKRSWGEKRKIRIGVANIEFLVRNEAITGEELFSH